MSSLVEIELQRNSAVSLLFFFSENYRSPVEVLKFRLVRIQFPKEIMFCLTGFMLLIWLSKKALQLRPDGKNLGHFLYFDEYKYDIT